MRKFHLLFLSSLLLGRPFLGILPAQEQKAYGEFSNKSKKAEKSLLKSARKETDYGNYKDAIAKYSELLKIDSANRTYNYEMGQLYYNNFQQPRSIPYFERTVRNSKDSLGEVYYFLGNSFHLSGKFDLAQKNYKTYLNLLNVYGTGLVPEEEIALREDVKHRVEMCENGKLLVQSPANKFTLNGNTRTFRIVSAGENVNSDYDDYGAILTRNDSLMFYTSRRADATGGKMDWDDKYFEDIFLSPLRSTGWGDATNIQGPINTPKHEAAISISPDGKTIYFYRGIKQGTFFSSKLTGEYWSEPEILYKESNINSKAWETSMFGFTLAGDELYVVSDREGGLGGRDIYVTKKDQGGAWGPLVNLGEPINTKYDEDAPFISADGRDLFFSSNGHNSMGGFDIFRCERQGDKWSAPHNLGTPFNTPGDDIYFTVSNTPGRAYYSSNSVEAEGRKDMNIYMIDLCDDVPTTTISGLAKGISKGTIVVSERGSGKEIGSFEISDGKYSISIEHGKNYVFTLKTSGIEPVATDISIPSQCKVHELYQELHFIQPGEPLVVKNAFFDIKSAAGASSSYNDFLAKADKSKLNGYSEASVKTIAALIVMVDTIKKITTSKDTTGKAKADTVVSVKTTIAFNNVLFAFGRADLPKEFLPELDKAIALLKKDFPKVKLEVAGHTDNVGKDAYNISLSKRRANAVANYLSMKGISKSRMNVTGYGPAKPIATNDTEEGRAKNRRTEIVIIQ